MSTKPIQQILAPPAPHMVGNGFRVHNFFPSGYNMGNKRMSPFFLMDYNAKIEFPPSKEQRGVGVHPHRGFETVTIAFHGKVAHHDSYGNSGVIGEGDVQWMTAGSGVLHKEYHDMEYTQKGGPFQMVQLWVNLPAKHKMTTPQYQAITQAQMGKFTIENNGGSIEIIAGNYKNIKGPATTFSPIEMYVIRANKGASVELNLPSNYNTGLLLIEGNAKINNDEIAHRDEFVLFKNEGETITLSAQENFEALLISGEPINEPIAAYGPFLMNTHEELQQAYDDFNAGKFGKLQD